ncbi:MAG: hypothetical protein [Caudoviricetes sp.]|nr:MAG: hypothetical protein [Caudoviricetes sp.]
MPETNHLWAIINACNNIIPISEVCPEDFFFHRIIFTVVTSFTHVQLREWYAVLLKPIESGLFALIRAPTDNDDFIPLSLVIDHHVDHKPTRLILTNFLPVKRSTIMHFCNCSVNINDDSRLFRFIWSVRLALSEVKHIKVLTINDAFTNTICTKVVTLHSLFTSDVERNDFNDVPKRLQVFDQCLTTTFVQVRIGNNDILIAIPGAHDHLTVDESYFFLILPLVVAPVCTGLYHIEADVIAVDFLNTFFHELSSIGRFTGCRDTDSNVRFHSTSPFITCSSCHLQISSRQVGQEISSFSYQPCPYCQQ